MRLTLIALLLAVALAFAAAASTPRTDGSSRRPTAHANAVPATEVARIRARLKHAERVLRGRDVSHLTPAQQVARAAALDALREYRGRGIFPHNHEFPGRRVPYFVDRHGRLGALAYLMARSGRPDLLARIAATGNNAYISERSADAELRDWLGRNGLTIDEAVSIQPAHRGW